MGILQRFSDIMSANINALLDKAEDPAKMIDQYLRNLESDLGNIKAETAAVMAEETRTKRELDECKAEVNRMQIYAEKAIMANNDEDAKQFLVKKGQLTDKQASLEQTYQLSAGNAAKMKEMHDKIVKDISSLNARCDAIKSKVAVAKTQEKINKLGAGISGAADNMSAFDRMEAKANKMVDEANAMSELNQARNESDIDDLASKYDKEPAADVEDELAALKEKMGK